MRESHYFGVPLRKLRKKLTYNGAFKYLSRLIVMRSERQADLASIIERNASNESSSQNRSVSDQASKTNQATF